jgi:uncharacterized protein with GYD domain
MMLAEAAIAAPPAHDLEKACPGLDSGVESVFRKHHAPANRLEERMPIYITQGRYTRDAIKGMIIKPEDRADQVSRLLSKVGGRLIGYYLTFGDYDFLSIAEVPNDTQMAAVLLAAASDLAPNFKSAGGGLSGHQDL